MAEQSKAVALAVEIRPTLTPIAQEYLEKNAAGDIAGKLSAWTTWVLDCLARGGVMMTPEDMEYLRGISGKPMESSKDITNAAESAFRRDEGALSVTVKIDPAWLEPLKEIAQQQGRESVTEMVQDFLNDMITEAYGYNLQPDKALRLTMAEFRELEQAIGKKNPFGRDVLNHIIEERKAKKAPKAA